MTYLAVFLGVVFGGLLLFFLAALAFAEVML